ncbi:ectoine/hydroxyectoine ABC transporter permease subunit EhuD [Leucobacter sp. CSA2]|uniref:Ectoine/hydroxyectoine ABC transporter permease subunit EhuD n=1 Tax=Leucobacter edaphi TaxID=2796472 RepID=A0A934UXD8_9MICO|nr:ectoine/hydroxyectoine ABC transporter permease subunit EhuD [Leucobacter edaphi]MBK0421910.1 ectoine/hydroxyectoine ABC transporter permease subunit EhuD [Leucobacter edaphi]
MNIWDNNFVAQIFPDLWNGFLLTLWITFVAFVISLAVGLVMAVLRFIRIPVVSHLAAFYVSFVRGTPLLVQAYIAYFVLPYFGIAFDPLPTGIVVLGLNYSAYTAEVYRSGIEQLPQGQWEAAKALSLPAARTWFRIVVPQAVRPIIPVLGNYLIMMFKDSAILSSITILELMGTSLQIGSNFYRYLEPITIAGLLYLAVSFPCSLLIRRLEHRLVPAH